MMNKVRVIYNPDKSVSIIHPAPKSRRILFEFEHEWLERVFDKATLNGAIYDDIDSSELPQSREDREFWEGEKGKGVKINQEKSQKNKKDKEDESKINDYIRQTAIDHLKASGDLPGDYKLKRK